MRNVSNLPGWVVSFLSGLFKLRIRFMLLLLVTGCCSLAACGSLGAQSPALSGHIKITGSTALQPLVTQAAMRFMRSHSQVKIDVEGGGSKQGLQDVNAGKADIGDSDIYADPAIYPDPTLTDHLVCVIPFTLIGNPDIGVKSLTQQQIIDIFSTGKLRNWQQVGGPNLAIVPVVRPQTSGTRATFRKYILGGRDETGTLLQSDSSQTVVQTVAQTPGAIGYVGVSVLNTSVSQVAIDGQLPTASAIKAGRYAFWGFEHMYTLGDGSAAVSSFLDYMLTSEIQQLAQQLGYIPIAAMSVASNVPTAASNLVADQRRKKGASNA